MQSQNQHPVQWENSYNQLNRHKSNDEEIDNKQNITITNSTSNVVTLEKHRMSYNFIRDLTKKGHRMLKIRINITLILL